MADEDYASQIHINSDPDKVFSMLTDAAKFA
jgi:carbon monoxide dehydrogenase subunit G